MGLLDELKKEAEAKQSQQQVELQRQAELQAHSRAVVLPKLAQIYSFLADLLKTIEVLQPDTRATYLVAGYGPLENLLQQDYELKADSRENMRHVSLGFYCIGDDKFSFTIEDMVSVEREKDYLNDHLLPFYTREYRDQRHTVTHALFTVESRIPVAFDFHLAEDLNSIKLIVRNFDGLGKHFYILEPEQIDDVFLDELAKYLLRHEVNFLKLDIPDDFRDNIRQRLEDEVKPAKSNKLFQKSKMDNVTYIDEIWKQAATNSTLQVEPELESELESESGSRSELELKAEAEQANISTDNAANEPRVELDVSVNYTKFANLPTPIKAASRQELDKKVYAEHLQHLQNFPDKLFQNAAQNLSSLNRLIIKPAKRHELLNSIIGQVYPVIASTFQKYQQQQRHCLPENHTRREVLLACASLIEQIAISYKQLFKAYVDNEASKHQEEILQSGFHILEMLRLEQRLRALRYQKMPSSAWRDCNTVFFYLYQHADINKELSLIGTAGIWPQQQELKGSQSAICTVNTLYLSIQFFGLLDVATWPLWLLHAPDTWLTYLDDALVILPDTGQKLVPGFLVSAANYDMPASFDRRDKTQSPSVLIDYAVLFNFLVKEHEDLSKMRLLDKVDGTRLSKPLRDIHAHDRIPLLEMILLSLHHRQRHQQRHVAMDNEELRVYFGFEDTYRLLSHLAATDKDELKEMRDFVDALAGKSSVLFDENQKSMPAWEMLNFSAGGLLLSTVETDFLSPIEVGQVVTFQSGNNAQTPVLGYVCRAQRTSYHNVEIAITRISNHVEAALAVKTDQRKKTGIPVTLLKDMDGKWRVLVQNQHGFVTGKPLEVIRADGKKVLARLGGIWLAKRRFTVYELSSPSLT